MVRPWTNEDFAHIDRMKGPEAFAWLQEGLTFWKDPRNIYRAFAPLSHRFDSNDDIEPQLAGMIAAMTIRQRAPFLYAIHLGFQRAEPTPDGFELFDSLQRIIRLAGEPKAADAMVRRLVGDKTFLAGFAPEQAQHLYANAFITLEAMEYTIRTAHYIRLLRSSSYYRPAYDDYVERILARGRRPDAL